MIKISFLIVAVVFVVFFIRRISELMELHINCTNLRGIEVIQEEREREVDRHAVRQTDIRHKRRRRGMENKMFSILFYYILYIL